MSNAKVPVFRKVDQPRMMSVAELIAAQRWHDEHKHDEGHNCDFCPLKVVVTKEEIDEFQARAAV